MKACNTCAVSKALTEFVRDPRIKTGVGGQCKSCRTSRLVAWRAGNPEKCAGYTRRWRADNVERVEQTALAWRQRNAGLRAANTAAWISANRPRHNASVAGRRAAEKRATPLWNDRDEMAMWYEVAQVLSRGGVRFCVDHVVPLKSKLVCGLHTHDNLTVIPWFQNLAKGNRHWPDMP